MGGFSLRPTSAPKGVEKRSWNGVTRPSKTSKKGKQNQKRLRVDDAAGGTGGGGGIGTARRLAGVAGGRWRHDALWRRRCAGRRALRGRPRAELRPDRPQRRRQDFTLQLHFAAL